MIPAANYHDPVPRSGCQLLPVTVWQLLTVTTTWPAVAHNRVWLLTLRPCGRSSEINNHRPRAGKALRATHGQPEGPAFPESGDSPGFLVNRSLHKRLPRSEIGSTPRIELAAEIAVEKVVWEIRPWPDVCDDLPPLPRRFRMSDPHQLL